MLIANKDRVYEDFPIPLINRLEKHYLVTSIMLSDKEKKLMDKIVCWVEDYTHICKSDEFLDNNDDASMLFEEYWQLNKILK